MMNDRLWALTIVAVAALSSGCELWGTYQSQMVDAGPDLVASGCFAAAGGCVECDPVTGPGCAGSAACDGGACADAGTCPACTAPPCDCDHLAQDRDPWPEQCNRLLFQDDFADALGDAWGRSYGDLFISVESCGMLEWRDQPHFTIWAWLTEVAAPLLEADSLVEVRLFPKLRGNWSFTVGAEVVGNEETMNQTTQSRSCSLRRRDGRFSLESRLEDESGRANDRVANFKLEGDAILQSWRGESAYHCRLITAAGIVAETGVVRTGGLPLPGTVKLTFSNNDFEAPYVWLWLDYVRIYAPPGP